MSEQKSKKQKETAAKPHPMNKHQGRYDFDALIVAEPALKAFVKVKKDKSKTIDFSKPEAVLLLNKALLKSQYKIDYWDIPENYLCPPIPGRAEYIHHVADLLKSCNKAKIPRGKKLTALDVGIGANAIYPIIGHQTYGWRFIGSDIDEDALQNAYEIISEHPSLSKAVELRIQEREDRYFYGVIDEEEFIDVTICNPPFHASAEDAEAANARKVKSLKKDRTAKKSLNFGGVDTELWCEGGERQFVKNMIFDSRYYSDQVLWFTSLVSKESNLKPLEFALRKAKVKASRIIPFYIGNKKSRILAWTFKSKREIAQWRDGRWR